MLRNLTLQINSASFLEDILTELQAKDTIRIS